MTHTTVTVTVTVTVTITEPTAIGDRSYTTAAIVASPSPAAALAKALAVGTIMSDALPWWPYSHCKLSYVGRQIARRERMDDAAIALGMGGV